MSLLNNLNILITRPIHQSEKLTEIIQLEGGRAIAFPTLEIKAINKENIVQQMQKISVYDFAIFISPNAVFKIADYLCPIWPQKTKIIAIGAGTAKALEHHNLLVDYYPKSNFSSEGILALPPLQKLYKKKILIIKGEDGRLTLSAALKKRDAKITTLEVYKRCLPHRPKTIPNVKSIDIIICTSNTGTTNLNNMLYPLWGDILYDKQLLVVSLRIAEHAKMLGFVKPALITDNASDEAILQTLLAYVRRNFKSVT